MGDIEFTCGLARCGKSTFSENWGRTANNNEIVLSGDKFRLALTGERFNLNSELHVKSSYFTAAKALYLSGYTILLDDTHTSLANVKQILEIDPNAFCYFFNVKADECIKRAIACGQEDLIHSIKRMEENLKITADFIFDNCRYTIVENPSSNPK